MLPERPYTHEENWEIIKYILKNEIFSDLKDVVVWKEIAEKKIVNRTYNSMKSHFKEHMVRNLHEFSITDDDKISILNAFEKMRSNSAENLLK